MSKYCNCKSPLNCVCPKCPKLPEDTNRSVPSLGLQSMTISDEECAKGYCRSASNTGSGDCSSQKAYENTIPEKLTFVIEWYENGSDLVKKYVLIYYGIDGTSEIKDVINNQRFLRRLKLDVVTIPQLFLGNVLNIYGRQMTITEYADSCTRQYLQHQNERAFLLIKPSAVECLGRIMQDLEQNFRVLRARMSRFTHESAATYFQQYSSQEFYSRLIEHMTSGPVVAFLLVGTNAIQKLAYMVGETDPAEAKLKHPQSLRAIYGKDIALNAFHISESPDCVQKDSSIFFTNCRKQLPYLAPGTALMQCSSCCIIKPHAVKDRLVGSIISEIAKAKFKVTAFELFYLDRTHAEEFFEIYKGVLPEYSNMTAELALGPCYAMEISGCGRETVEEFREFTGPMDPYLARKLRPNSLRAKFGNSVVENAVHCTDLPDDAEMEIDYFFRILQML